MKATATDQDSLLDALFYRLLVRPELPWSFNGHNTALAYNPAGRLHDALSMLTALAPRHGAVLHHNTQFDFIMDYIGIPGLAVFL